MFSAKKLQKKNPVILVSSQATAEEEECWKTWQSTNKTKNHRIQQVYGQHRLFRHDAVHLIWVKGRQYVYWKTVAFKIIARMVLNSYILYKENYREPGKLKSRYNYTLHNRELGGGVVVAERQCWGR
jgi:hypothetical protein